MCILFCHPQFHGGMFLLFLCFSSPRIMVFAEKGIFIFMIFRGGSAHLRNEMLAAGRKFFNFSAFRNFSGGGPETGEGRKGRQRTIHTTYTFSYRVVRVKSRLLKPRCDPLQWAGPGNVPFHFSRNKDRRSPRSLRTRVRT